MKSDYDIIIVGAGLVGLTAALACAQNGLSIALLDAREIGAQSDERASALTSGSYNLFGHLGLHSALKDKLQPIEKMHIADGHIGNISPLALQFLGTEEDGPTGYMVENKVLRDALLEAVRDSESIDVIAPTQLLSTQRGASHVTVQLPEQTISAALLVGADGRGSSLRQGAQIPCKVKPYNQKALVTTFAHNVPHGATAYQYFFSGGPLALLPLTENRMSIVWSDRPEAIEAAMALPEADFVCELERRMDHLLGDLILCAPRQSFPLSLQIAQRYTDHRLVLIGDAAHAIHPLAGQGLNLGLRDIAALVDILALTKSRGQDIGISTLAQYETWRSGDAHLLSTTTNLLNSLFSNDIRPLRHARRIGLSVVNKLARPKHLMVHQLANPTKNTPRLLRG